MSHLLGVVASNANIDSIYFLTKNGANATTSCQNGRLCGMVEARTDKSHFFDL